MYMGFTRVNHPDLTDSLMWRKSTNGMPGAAWSPLETRILPQNAPAPLFGFGAMPVVQPSSAGVDAGKLIMVYEQPGAFNHSDFARIDVCRNGSPELSQEEYWESAIQLVNETGPGTPSIYPVFGLEAFYGPLVVGQHPSICRDPADARTVYVAFIGSATQYPNPADQNVDIYIAKITYRLDGVIDRTVQRLSDTLLSDNTGACVNGADQFFPAITVDGYGGINLAYLRMPHQPITDSLDTPPIDVSYIRFTQFPVPTGSPLAPYRLTQPYSVFPHANPRIGDYISIDSSGCLIYVAYPKVESTVTDRCSVYVTRISVCQADIDNTGVVDANDVVAFGQGFSQGTAGTDMNADGVHNGTDLSCFLNFYTCGCAQQP